MHALYLNRAIASYLKVVWPSLVAASMQQIGGSGGMLLQEKILRRSEITSEAIFGQKILGKEDLIVATHLHCEVADCVC